LKKKKSNGICGSGKKKKISRPFLYYRARLRLVLLFLVIDGGKKRERREREKRIEGKIKGDKSGGKKEEKYSRVHLGFVRLKKIQQRRNGGTESNERSRNRSQFPTDGQTSLFHRIRHYLLYTHI
jgi:hypothetical protein